MIIRRIEMKSMRTNEEILEEIHQVKNHKKTTQTIYKYAVEKYCKLNNKTLHELITEAEQEEEQGIRWKHRTLKRRLLNFRKQLVDNYYHNTVNNTFTPILVIYHYFEIEIHDLPRLEKKNFINPAPITFDDLPDKEVIREAVNIATSTMKAIILFMSSSGCARRETLNLTVLDYMNATKEYHNTNDIHEMINTLKDIKDVVPTFNILRQKTQKYYITYCSPEAVVAINHHLLQRQNLTLESKLFKIHEDYFNQQFIKINNELRLGKVGNYNRFRSHMLRKYHASTLYNDGMSLDKVNDLQGKSKSRTDSVYFMTNPEDLKQEYIEHLPALMIMKEVEKVTVKSPEYLKLERDNMLKDKELSELNNRVGDIERLIRDNISKDRLDRLREFL